MFALFALLVVGATAAPQVPLYQYPVYPQYQYQYGYQPQLRYIPSPVYPSYYYPGAVSPVQAQTRGIFGLPDDINILGFQSASAGFSTQGSDKTMVLQGNAEFKQNPFSSDSQYTVYLVDGGNVNVAGTEFNIYVYDTACTSSVSASDVTGASSSKATLIATVTAPSLLVNGFYAKGTTSTYNVDGSNSKTTIKGKYIYVLNKDKDTINGCTGAIA